MVPSTIAPPGPTEERVPSADQTPSNWDNTKGPFAQR